MQHYPTARSLSRLAWLAVAVALIWLAWPAASQDAGAAGAGLVMPAYDDERRLLLPEGYRQWVFIGSSLGLSYNERFGGMEMFHHTFMEPTAHAHFRRTGEFREGTMFALMLHGIGEGEPPQRSGRFAAEVHAVEMAVKDSRTFEDGWAYFDFGGMGGMRDRAAAFPSESCHSCHAEHGAHDNVFLQFYPLLREAAPADSAARGATDRGSTAVLRTGS